MKLSIIIPVYNTRQCDLNACITSIVTQCVGEIEIILVDDGSNIDVANYLDSIAERNTIVRVFHKTNEGVSVARNYGVSKAQGEYIMFVDADDVLAMDALSDGINMIEETQCDMVIGQILYTKRENIKQFGEEIERTTKKAVLDEQKDKDKYIAHIFDKRQLDWGQTGEETYFNFEGCWARIIKRTIVQNVSFTQGMKVCEDTEWAVRIVTENPDIRIGLSYKLWYYYIDTPYSALNTFNGDMPQQIYRGIVVLKELVQNQSNIVKDAYLCWVFIKLKQLIVDYYYAPECRISFVGKILSYRKYMRQSAFKGIEKYIIKNIRLRMKWRMYSSGMAIVRYKL